MYVSTALDIWLNYAFSICNILLINFEMPSTSTKLTEIQKSANKVIILFLKQ